MRRILTVVVAAAVLGGCGALVGGSDMTPEQLHAIVSAITASARSYCLNSEISVPGTFTRKFRLAGTGIRNGKTHCNENGDLSVESVESAEAAR